MDLYNIILIIRSTIEFQKWGGNTIRRYRKNVEPPYSPSPRGVSRSTAKRSALYGRCVLSYKPSLSLSQLTRRSAFLAFFALRNLQKISI